MCLLYLQVKTGNFLRKYRITMTQKERRRNKERDIWNLSELLNEHQISALNQTESSGWQVFCVRISLFQDPVVVVVNSDGDAFATMEYDGELNLTPDLSLRKDDLRVCTVKKTTPSRTSTYLQRRRLDWSKVSGVQRHRWW
jgi:hypothetical protein